MRDKSLEAKQKRAVTSQQTYIHAVRSSRSYVLACGAVHAAPPVGHRPLRPVLPHPSARRIALSAPYYPIRVSNGVLCVLLLHPLAGRHYLRPVVLSAHRAAPFAPCYPIRHLLAERRHLCLAIPSALRARASRRCTSSREWEARCRPAGSPCSGSRRAQKWG